MFDERPQTKAIRRDPRQSPFLNADDGFNEEDNKPNLALDDFQPKVKKAQKVTNPRSAGIKGRVIELNISESWGDLFYVGLNGIQIIDTNN